MKAYLLSLIMALASGLGMVYAQPPRVKVDGNWYTDGQTAYIQCDKSSIEIEIDQVYGPDGPYKQIGLVTSPNFTFSGIDEQIDQLNLDSSHQDGWIHVSYAFESGYIVVNIVQKPPKPTFTASPLLCTTSSSGTYSVSDSYNFQSTKPINLIWQTTGGVTVNGTNTVTTSSATTSSVTIQYNSLGSLTVKAVIPDCGNLESETLTIWIGIPGSSFTFAATGGSDPGFSLCSGQTYNFQSNPNLPLSQYSYSWSIPTGSSNVSYFYSYGPNATLTAGSSGVGFVLQLSITNLACTTSTNTSRTFYNNSCGSFIVANNPATNELTAQFDSMEDSQYVPSTLRLSNDKNSIVEEVKVKGLYSDQAIKTGLKIKIDVHSLPRGVYYLQGIYDTHKTEAVRVLLQ